VGRYLQMVWAATKFVGAAFAVGPSGGTVLLVYCQRGNVIGELPYSVAVRRNSPQQEPDSATTPEGPPLPRKRSTPSPGLRPRSSMNSTPPKSQPPPQPQTPESATVLPPLRSPRGVVRPLTFEDSDSHSASSTPRVQSSAASNATPERTLGSLSSSGSFRGMTPRERLQMFRGSLVVSVDDGPAARVNHPDHHLPPAAVSPRIGGVSPGHPPADATGLALLRSSGSFSRPAVSPDRAKPLPSAGSFRGSFTGTRRRLDSIVHGPVRSPSESTPLH
jgi:hypothetical protein